MVCQNCPTGSYSNVIPFTTSVECQKCEAGKTTCEIRGDCNNHATDYDSILDCQACPSGRYADPISIDGTSNGPANCKICQGGKYVQVPDSSSRECLNCPVAKFLADDGNFEIAHAYESSCFNCNLNEFSTEGSRFCSTCSVGKIAFTRNGVTECDSCLAGYYQPAVGQTECLECVAGQHQPNNVKFADINIFK